MSCIFGKIPHAALIPMPSAHLIHAPTYKWTKSKNCSVCWEWVLNQLPNYFSSQKSWQVERRESNYSVYLTLRLSPTLDCVCALVIITMFSTYVTSDLRKSHVEQFSNGKSQKTGFFFSSCINGFSSFFTMPLGIMMLKSYHWITLTKITFEGHLGEPKALWALLDSLQQVGA